MQELEHKARAFAAKCHSECGHVRQYTGYPYIVHPEAVAEIVRGVHHSQQMLAAAWLHDTVEYCEDVTVDIILALFGSEVAELVEMLTYVSKPSDGNRATRERIDREHSAKASPDGQTIKVADLIDNSKFITEYAPDFARVFMAEMKATLAVLPAAESILVIKAKMIVRDYYENNQV